MKSNKASGPDGIPSEIWESSETLAEHLHTLLQHVWEKEDVPQQFQRCQYRHHMEAERIQKWLYQLQGNLSASHCEKNPRKGPTKKINEHNYRARPSWIAVRI